MLTFLMRAFALSFSIFIRAIPAWFVLAGVLYAGFSMLAGTPMVFFFILSLAAGTIIYFMIFVHVRSGLVAMGETTAPDLGKLVMKSWRFFRFAALWQGMVSGLVFGGFLLMGKLGVYDWELTLTLLATGGEASEAELLKMFTSPAIYVYYTVSTILAQLAYCAIAVPMAANAAACSHKARDYEIFWGFGAGLWRMFLLQLSAGTVIGGMILAYIFIGLTMPVFNGQSALQITDFENLAAPDGPAAYAMIAILVALPIAAYVWIVSLWCAGATLCFMEHREVRQAAFNRELERVYEAPMAREDLRALRESRMSGMAAPSH